MGLAGQMFDLESLVEHASAYSFTFDLAWLPQHTTSSYRLFSLLSY